MAGHGHRFNVEKASLLVAENRYKALPPDQIIKHLEIKKDDIAADLGAGNGFFTLPIAKATENTVYAFDIEPKMLSLLEERAAEEKIDNITTIESSLEPIKLLDQSVDKLLISLVLHEVPNLQKTLAEMKRILKPNGAGMIIEWEAKETESGPPLHERIPSEELANIVKKVGFTAETISLNESYYALLIKIV